ncbi:MAG TPA: hypothetical protein VH497_01715 [Vicinamibacterales bacterium]
MANMMMLSAFSPSCTRADVRQAFREQASRHEQRHRQRDLGCGEGEAEPRCRARTGRLPGRALQGRYEVGTRAVQRGKEAEQQTGTERERGSEQNGHRVQPGHDGVGGILGEDGQHQVERPLRHEETADSAEHREEAGFSKQLPHQLAASGADGEPHGHFTGPGRCARQQQVRDVRARDEQHERRHAEEQRQRRASLDRHVALPACARLHAQRLRLELRHPLVAHAALERHFDVVDDVVIRRGEGRSRLVDRDAGLQAAEYIRPVRATVLEVLERLREAAHRDRREDRRLQPERRAVESTLRHADDRHRLAVDRDGLIQDRGIQSEAPLPVAPAEDHDVRFAGSGIVRRRQQPSDGRLDADDREVVAGHEQPVDAFSLAARGEVGPERDVRGEAGKRRLGFFEVAEHRITEHPVAVALLAARIRPGLRPRRPDVHEPVRFRHRQRTEQDLIEEREDGRVRADAERQRHDGHRRHERRLEQGPDRELDVRHMLSE